MPSAKSNVLVVWTALFRRLRGFRNAVAFDGANQQLGIVDKLHCDQTIAYAAARAAALSNSISRYLMSNPLPGLNPKSASFPKSGPTRFSTSG